MAGAVSTGEWMNGLRNTFASREKAGAATVAVLPVNVSRWYANFITKRKDGRQVLFHGNNPLRCYRVVHN